MYLSVVVPCYNEHENIERGVLGQMVAFLASQPYASELIISDDGSSDDSLTLVQDFTRSHPAVRVLANPHQGKPAALRAALSEVQGAIVLLMDMDQSTPVGEVVKLLPYFDQGYAAPGPLHLSQGRKQGFSRHRSDDYHSAAPGEIPALTG